MRRRSASLFVRVAAGRRGDIDPIAAYPKAEFGSGADRGVTAYSESASWYNYKRVTDTAARREPADFTMRYRSPFKVPFHFLRELLVSASPCAKNLKSASTRISFLTNQELTRELFK